MFTLLIVDDNLFGLRTLMMSLQDEEYQLYSAQSGTEALELARQIKPDLILLDIMLPDINGFEICKRLKASESTADIPIIFLSALDEETNKLEGLTIGGEDYITKPFSPDEVSARVRIHLAKRERQMQLQQLREQDQQYYTHLATIRDALLDQMRHDIKTPMSSIKASSHLINRHNQAQDTRIENYTQRINHAVDETLHVIEHLLQIVKLESGCVTRIQCVEIEPFIQRVIPAYQALAETQDIQFLVQYHGQPDAIANFDPDQMQSAISNLLSNALKYTKSPGAVRLDISLNNQTLNIEVSDTGRGIPQKYLSKIFDRAYRIPESGRPTEGDGLGLHIVKSVMERHKGSIKVLSKINEGSIFTMSIPANQVALSI